MFTKYRIAALAVVAFLFSNLVARADDAKHPHPHMMHALHELRESHKELKEAKHDFGGHKEAAMKDIHHAITQIELALKEDGGHVVPKGFGKDIDYKKHASYPHLHESLVELKEAHKELTEAKHDYHGHREAAAKAVHKAIEQVEILIKHK